MRRKIGGVVCFLTMLLLGYCWVATLPRYYRGHTPAFMDPMFRDRFQQLTPGMTAQEVWEELGLLGQFLDGGLGSGPMRGSCTSYYSRPDCGVIFVFDNTVQPSRLVKVYLSGDGWSD